MTDNKHKRGFASMSLEKRRAAQSKGGKVSSANFKYHVDRAREAGKKGGAVIAERYGKTKQ